MGPETDPALAIKCQSAIHAKSSKIRFMQRIAERACTPIRSVISLSKIKTCSLTGKSYQGSSDSDCFCIIAEMRVGHAVPLIKLGYRRHVRTAAASISALIYSAQIVELSDTQSHGHY